MGGSSMSAENRRHVRKAISVEFKGTEASGVGELVFEAADLSAGGTFLKADLLLEQGEKLWLTFKVPGMPRAMRAEGRVKWVRRFPEGKEPSGMGVEFEHFADDDRAVLA